MNSLSQLGTQSNSLIQFYVAHPAEAEARIIGGRWPEAKTRAIIAAKMVDAGNVTLLKRNTYLVKELEIEESHTVYFSTLSGTGGYSCNCNDWFGSLMGFKDSAPYPKDWAGCSPMCPHVLAVEIGTRIEAIEDEPIPW